MENICGDVACIPTSATTFKCDCPIGYNGIGCLGKNFFFFFFFFIFQKPITKRNRY